MKYIVDHDVHIHTHFSPCSNDSRQTPEAILAAGLAQGFELLALTDHAWDTTVPSNTVTWGSLDRVKAHLPLPQSKSCHMLFGMEADMNYEDILGVSKATLEALDFAVLALNHLHMDKFTVDKSATPDDALTHKRRFIERIHTALSLDLPFYKTTLAHFSDGVLCSDLYGCLQSFTDAEYRDIFTKVRDRGMGVELNLIVASHSTEGLREVLRPFFIAKEVGCKFTLGGDAHWPEEFVGRRQNMERVVELLDLEESDKLPYIREWIDYFKTDPEGKQRPFLGMKL